LVYKIKFISVIYWLLRNVQHISGILSVEVKEVG